MEQEALQLKNEGYTYQEIADQLGISKTGAFRLLQKAGKVQKPMPNTKDFQGIGHIDSDQVQLELKRLELEHEREMAKLQLQERELELREQEFFAKEKQKRELEESELAIALIEERKKNLFERFLKLVRRFLELVDTHEWDKEDMENFFVGVEKFQEKIEETYELIGINPYNLKSYIALEIIKEILGSTLDKIYAEAEEKLSEAEKEKIFKKRVLLVLEDDEQKELEEALELKAIR